MTNDTLLTISEAANYCRLPAAYFRNLVRFGHGPRGYRISERRRFFPREELDRWIQNWKSATTGGANG